MWLNFVAFFVEIFTGFVLWLAVPFGPVPKSWGFSQQVWLSIHKWGAIPVMAVIAIHLFLHWKWMINQFKSLFK
jgi:cytochrome b subunit of formate dehydrogenase